MTEGCNVERRFLAYEGKKEHCGKNTEIRTGIVKLTLTYTVKYTRVGILPITCRRCC